MTVVVSDASPLHLLIELGLADILPRLFSSVLVPSAVVKELIHSHAPADVRMFMATPPAWLTTRDPAFLPQFVDLNPGETAAIGLASELNALLMIDERQGRAAAMNHGVRVVGAIGVLERAANEGFITDLAKVYAGIRARNFHISDKILSESIVRHRTHARSPDAPQGHASYNPPPPPGASP